MCGLAGVLFSRRERPPAVYRRVWERFSGLFTWAQTRGRDASGVAIIKRQGSFCLLKDRCRANDLAQRDEYHRMRSQVGDDTVAILGHARLKTRGSPEDPRNNHPIYLPASRDGLHGPLIGIHNGMVRNADRLRLKYGYEREGSVDSEVLLRLVAEACNWPGMRDRMLKNHLGEVYGQATLVWVLLDRPETVFIARKREPLNMVLDEEQGILYFATLRRFFLNVFGEEVQVMPFEDHHVGAFDMGLAGSPLADGLIPFECPEESLENLSFDALSKIARSRGFE